MELAKQTTYETLFSATASYLETLATGLTRPLQQHNFNLLMLRKKAEPNPRRPKAESRTAQSQPPRLPPATPRDTHQSPRNHPLASPSHPHSGAREPAGDLPTLAGGKMAEGAG